MTCGPWEVAADSFMMLDEWRARVKKREIYSETHDGYWYLKQKAALALS